MPRIARVASGGVVQHVLNRGNGRLRLFRKPGDYRAFVDLLGEALDRAPGVRMLGWCLMPNHWHLVTWPTDDGDLSAFMRWLANTHVRRWRGHGHSVGQGARVPGAVQELPRPGRPPLPDPAAVRRGERPAGGAGDAGPGLAVVQPGDGGHVRRAGRCCRPGRWTARRGGCGWSTSRWPSRPWPPCGRPSAAAAPSGPTTGSAPPPTASDLASRSAAEGGRKKGNR